MILKNMITMALVGSCVWILGGCRSNSAPEGEVDLERRELRALFGTLTKSKNAEQEADALRAIMDWSMKARPNRPEGHPLSVSRKMGDASPLNAAAISRMAESTDPVVLVIECNSLPPVTPWIRHRFHASANAGLLAR